MTERAKKAFRVAYETLRIVKQIQEDFSEPYTAHIEVEEALKTIEALMSVEDWKELYEK